MDNIWTKINCEVPQYFNTLAEKYSMKFLKVTLLKTAIVAEKFILLISIDRFSADVDYIMRDKTSEIIIYSCGNFFAERYDSADRTNLVEGNTAENMVINNLIIISNGLQSKWSKVLHGDIEWINDFKHSIWFSECRLNQTEKNIISKHI
ncbi:hypothetical protein SAMN05660742_1373 [Propionispira arboris]|uniref:Uncharacterized protein n=2 Tax=Propionispira arboris TaxID=84035 RepID=A0A1H7D835_9FIRM|nr:hypothetical protein SAMN05660742_1373 [Propionispira arboris]